MVTNILRWVSVILPAAAFCLAYVPQANARTRNHDCTRNPVLQDTVDRANPGDVVAVSGTCTGTTIVAVNNLTLDGTGSPDDATLNGGVIVRANGVHIKRFMIQNSQSGAGISVEQSGSAFIEDNIIGGLGVSNATGISVEQSSSAIIEGNYIQYSDGNGISVSGGSYARIGPLIHTAPGNNNGSANVIKENGSHGIDVRGSASADIFDSKIDTNPRGVEVAVGGSANMAGNEILNSSDRGISLSTNGAVAFVAMHGNTSPDKNDIHDNSGTGLYCELGGAASGIQPDFSVNGTDTDTTADGTCAISLTPAP